MSRLTRKLVRRCAYFIALALSSMSLKFGSDFMNSNDLVVREIGGVMGATGFVAALILVCFGVIGVIIEFDKFYYNLPEE